MSPGLPGLGYHADSVTTLETNMNGKKRSGSRTAVRGKGWKRATTIDTKKYEVIARAIMSSLTTTPIAFSDLVKRVGAKLDSFDGSVPWYTLSCLRELEIRGRVQKHQRPVRYSRKSAPKSSK